VSRSEDSLPDEAVTSFLAVDAAVGRAVQRLRDLEARARAADDRAAEIEQLLERMASGDESPVQMKDELDRLQRENADLRQRLDQGREGVERLLARIRFLEEQR
jgi:predicted RNase H-like nuclease (RuvC/YqgF family)